MEQHHVLLTTLMSMYLFIVANGKTIKHGKGTYLIYDNNKLLSRRILNHYEDGNLIKTSPPYKFLNLSYTPT